MSTQFPGTVQVNEDTAAGRTMITLDPDKAEVSIGGVGAAIGLTLLNGTAGTLQLVNQTGTTVLNLDSSAGGIVSVRDSKAHVVAQLSDHFSLGGHNAEGSIALFDSSSHISTPDQATIRLRSAFGSSQISVGGNGAKGYFALFPPSSATSNPNGDATVYLHDGVIRAGGADNTAGQLFLLDGSKRVALKASGAVMEVGGHGNDGEVHILDKNDAVQIKMLGASGDIELAGGDCAEEFEVGVESGLEPGVVVIVDVEGRLRPSSQAYDRKVTGVVSGAGDLKPGIVLDRRPDKQQRAAVAVVGKVWCKADASHGPIEAGDLLTTSPTPGHAMRASDPLRAFGAVIGKALRPLQQGQGLIQILVALQ